MCFKYINQYIYISIHDIHTHISILAGATASERPLKEISGLGAAETDGGRLYSALQRAYAQIAELRQQTHAEPLQTEVCPGEERRERAMLGRLRRELGMLVRSQEP